MASAATGPTDVRYDCEPGGGDAAEVTKGRGAAIHSGAAGGDRPLRGRDRRSPRSRAPPDVRIPVRLLARAYAGRRLPGPHHVAPFRARPQGVSGAAGR